MLVLGNAEHPGKGAAPLQEPAWSSWETRWEARGPSHLWHGSRLHRALPGTPHMGKLLANSQAPGPQQSMGPLRRCLDRR